MSDTKRVNNHQYKKPQRPSTLVADDAVLAALGLWKKRIIEAFALLSLLIAILVALLIEVGALVDTLHRELLVTPVYVDQRGASPSFPACSVTIFGAIPLRETVRLVAPRRPCARRAAFRCRGRNTAQARLYWARLQYLAGPKVVPWQFRDIVGNPARTRT